MDGQPSTDMSAPNDTTRTQPDLHSWTTTTPAPDPTSDDPSFSPFASPSFTFTFTNSATTTSTFTPADLDPCDVRNSAWYPDLTQLPWVLTLLVGLYLVIIVLSICGNALVIVTVWRNPHMHTVTNYYIVNLAVSDLLVSLLVMPLKLLEYTGPCGWNVYGNRLLCPVISYMQPIFVFASVLTLVAISLER
ncbi:hypothetical protein ACOMHN_015268 [Nucella lapillus]